MLSTVKRGIYKRMIMIGDFAYKGHSGRHDLLLQSLIIVNDISIIVNTFTSLLRLPFLIRIRKEGRKRKGELIEIKEEI